MALHVVGENHRHSSHCSCSSYVNILHSACWWDNRNLFNVSVNDRVGLHGNAEGFGIFRARTAGFRLSK